MKLVATQELKKIVVTGGHLTPALAVIDELIRRGKWQIIFFGRKYTTEGDKSASVEEEAIEERDLPFVPINAGRLQRRMTRFTLPSLLKIPVGFFQSLYYLKITKPDVILSFGGYVSVPVVVAGWLLKIPIVTHEQTNVSGLASKINAIFAKAVAISWPNTMASYPKNKVILTGNPVRGEIFNVNEKIFKSLDFEKGLPLILVTGGNQGSHIINTAIREILPRLTKVANIIHQCGRVEMHGDYEALLEAKGLLPKKLSARYHVKKYLNATEMGTFLNKASLVIGRSGANTVTELMALGKPALLIPFPWLYKNEQTKNARELVSVGLGQVLPQKELSAEMLLEKINQMLANLGSYKINNSFKLFERNADKKVADLVDKIANKS